jgi:hypothetical protein
MTMRYRSPQPPGHCMPENTTDWSALIFFPEVGNAVATFMGTIEGPYVLRVPALIRRGNAWVECEAVVFRQHDGVLKYEAHPIAYARTLAVEGVKVFPAAPSGAGDAPPIHFFAGGQFGQYRESDVASPLQAAAHRTGSMDLIVIGAPADGTSLGDRQRGGNVDKTPVKRKQPAAKGAPKAK